jgi:ELWxxDGT repeat protein
MKAILSLGVFVLLSLCSLAQEVPVLVNDMVPGNESSFKLNHYDYQVFTTTNEAFYFYTHSNDEGVSFWRSDGSKQGTYPLVNFPRNTVFESLFTSSKLPVEVAAVENNIYFPGYDLEHGIELWHTDGSIESTALFVDLMPGPANSDLFGLTNFNDQLLFFADGLDENGEVFPYLWISRGGANTTTRLRRFKSIYNSSNRFCVGETLAFFNADDGVHGTELWKTDGTLAGTSLLKDLIEGTGSSNASILTFSNGMLYFSLYHPTYGYEPWISDATAEGTRILKDIYPGELGSYPGLFIPIENKVYFRARKFGDIYETIHVTDGTPSGTLKIGDGGNSGTGNWIAFKDRLFYQNPGEDKIKSTVDAPGNIQVNAYLKASFGRFLVASDSVLYFIASGDDNGNNIGYEPWRTNGTQEGTYLIGDVNSYPHEGSYPAQGFIFKGELYFIADDKIHGRELWKAIHPSNVIAGNVYLDVNKNHIFDKREPVLSQQKILIEPGNTIAYTDFGGNFKAAPEPGTYSVKVQPSPEWKLSSSQERFDFNIPGTTNERAVFGLTPLTERHELAVNLNSSSSRCGFKVTYWLSYTNTGNVIANGQLHLQHDSKATLVDANPTPDKYENGNLSWNFEDLYPTEQKTVMLNFIMPGVDFINDSLLFVSKVSITGTDFIATDTLVQYITCSYDPNDKQVKPAGIEEEHYTLKNSWLDYTIRFQNTGNDTAFTVLLRDTLYLNLDPATFEIISSSHNMQASRKEGVLAFSFENILLPDSTTNEPASHGYVRYRIKAKAGLADNTVVQNKAYIFFDFNPAIETNTTFNTLVTSLPQRVVSGLHDQKQELKLYPNPTEASVNILTLIPMEEIRVYNSQGKLVYHELLETPTTSQQLSLQQIPPGIYLLKVRAGKSYLQQRLVKY